MLKQDFHHINETLDLDIPIILFDRINSNVYCDKVIIDDIEGAKKATNHLISNESRKSILLITTEDYVSVGNLRTTGYIQALKETNIGFDTDLIIKVEDKKSTEEELHNIEERINEVLKLKSNIDGIFAVNEIYAASAQKVLKKIIRKFQKKLASLDLQMVLYLDFQIHL